MEKITIALLIIGFIILLVALYFIFKKINSTAGSTNDMDPNNEYMEKIGAVCPTGWVYKGESAGNNICENYYKLPISDTDKCYNNKDTKVNFFSKHFNLHYHFLAFTSLLNFGDFLKLRTI